jgi:aryl-alcohol dehydrogenase-like predicted oxidoreductase
MQVEYSLFSLDIEGPESTDLLKTCRELGVCTFAYSPVGRGFLTAELKSPDDFGPQDFRRLIPRFSAENFPKNLALVDRVRELAESKGATASQLALAWLLAQGDDIVPIPGTKRIKYLEENVAALKVQLSTDEVEAIRKMLDGVVGGRIHAGIPIVDFEDTPEL